jgi:dienelactone hydrolase
MKDFVLGIVFALLVAAGGLAYRLLGYADAQGRCGSLALRNGQHAQGDTRIRGQRRDGMRWRWVPWLAAAVLAMAGAVSTSAQDLVESELRIPMKEAGKKGLEATMVRPNDGVAHPLALLAHGTPREPNDREGMTPWSLLPQAREFARRGWTTVIVMRRGYGDSGGGYREEANACSPRVDYYDSGRESAKDLRSAIAYLSTRPEVDASRIISVGISAGGFATVALTAEPPPGLVAAISFAGGRGSKRPDEVCNVDELVRTFGDFGKKSRVPMLWVYAENDHFFGPQIATRFYQAFTATGGKAILVRAAAFRKDGHGLFSLGGIPIWTPMVDNFLTHQNLQLRSSLLALPTPAAVAAPSQLSPEASAEFRSFLTLPAHKAFAVSGGGHYGYVFGRRTEKEASKLAEERCRESAEKADPCSVVMLDERKGGT